MANLLFTFEDMSQKDKATKGLMRYFQRAGLKVAQAETNPSTKRSSGVSYREMTLTFADSQKVLLRVKQTGDIYQILVNGKVLPLKYPDDHIKAVAELVKAMDSGRAAFQKKMAAVKVPVPAGIRTAAPRIQAVLTEKRDALNTAIAAVRDEIAKYEGAPAAA